MKTLYELSKINSKQIRVIESLLPSDPESPLRKLNTIVYSKGYLNDQECMIKIYRKRNLTAFSRLKSRLKEIYYQAIILQSNFPDDDDSRVFEATNSYRQTLAARVMISKKSSNLAIELLEKSIAKSIKFHVSENVIGQARMLALYYGGSVLNKYKFNKYSEILEKYTNIYRWEVKAELYFLDLQKLQLASLANVSDETKAKALRYCKELQNVTNIRTYFFNYNKYRIMAAYYEYEKDYDSLLEISSNALIEFSAPDFKSGVALSGIYVRQLWALLQAGRIKETISVGLKSMNKVVTGGGPWYRIGHYTLKAQLYNSEYSQAAELISVMINHQKFQKLWDYYQELFNTTLGYIHLIADSGIADNGKEIHNKLPEFKLGKFLNTTPLFSKDKRGINVSILLMHIAFLLQRKDYNAIIDRIDSLNQYAYRYLRKDDSFRSNCMIKMVIQITKADFNLIRTERYTADLRKQLSQVNLAGSGENIEIEIIPFEVLWDIMVKAL